MAQMNADSGGGSPSRPGGAAAALGAGIVGQGIGSLIGGGDDANLAYSPLDRRNRGLLLSRRFNAGQDAKDAYLLQPGEMASANRLLEANPNDPYSAALAHRGEKQFLSSKQQFQNEGDRMRQTSEMDSINKALPEYNQLVNNNENISTQQMQAAQNTSAMRNQAIADLIGGVGAAGGAAYGYMNGEGDNKYENAGIYGRLGAALGEPFKPSRGPRRIG